MRVQDLTNCSPDGSATGVANAVVEIWHCDAGGVYSGFESGSQAANQGGGMGGAMGGAMGRPPQGGPGGGMGMGGSGETSDGSYSVGDQEATTTDDGTYLRGAQTTDADGIVQFTTVFPGWYTGRTVHIHLKVHIDKKTVLTTQLFFDDTFTDEILSTVSPYADHTGRDTRNASDGIFDEAGLMATSRQSDRVLAAINLGIDA
ncbi:protocatechuate 3,4-dioxygenase beta subunit [Rhodococcus sp. BE178]